MIDKTTLFLYSPFEGKDVGNPRRGKIKGVEHFKRFLDANDGINDCFVSLHNLNQTYINKLWLDFDEQEGEHELTALEEAQMMYEYLQSKNVSTIPVASGNPYRQGIHLYILTKPIYINNIMEAKKYITNLTYKLIDNVFGNDNNKLKAKHIDYPLISDINRVVRIPGTLRPPQNVTWCTYLPQNFTTFNEFDLKKHIRKRHEYIYDLFNPLIHDSVILNEDLIPPHKSVNNRIEEEQLVLPIEVTESAKLLVNIIRPCLYKEMISPNPKHEVRVVATIDLLQFFPVDFILELYRGLDWVDFDEDITFKFIEHAKKYKPYSCPTLRKKGIIGVCDC